MNLKIVQTCRLFLIFMLSASGLHCNLLGDENGSTFSHAYYFPSCGPTDGPAFEVYLTVQPTSCEALQQALEQRYLRLYVVGVSAPVVPSVLRVDPASSSMEGVWAEKCDRAGVCAAARGGSIRFNEGLDEGAATISLDLQFEDGTESGQFPLHACERPFLCG